MGNASMPDAQHEDTHFMDCLDMSLIESLILLFCLFEGTWMSSSNGTSYAVGLGGFS